VPAIKALIIDDSEADRALVKRALSRADETYDVVEAASRADLEERLSCDTFDLVISDYNILGLTGLEVLDVVQDLSPDTPVVLLTGTGSEEIAAAAIKRGAADYVVKSVKHVQKLPTTVTAVLDRVTLARERVKLAEELRASEERYRTLVETAEEAVVSVDGKSSIMFFSAGARRMFGYEAEDIEGRPFETLVPVPARSVVARQVDRKLARRSNGLGGVITVPLLRHGGREFPAEISLSAAAGGGSRGFTAVIRDVTEKKRMEEELARLDRLAAIGEMTSGIAHEVRNPLAAIATSAAVARQELAAAGLETDSVEWIVEGVRKIEALLKRFFDFAKPLSPERETVDVAALLREVVEEEGPRLVAAGVAVEFDLAEGLPALQLDRGLMKSVFENVVVNARQIMPEGGNLTIRMRADAAEANVVLTFADTGPGITPEEARRALEPFFTTKADGVGLGLPLCVKIVKAHGGDLGLAGRELGAEVTVTLPVTGVRHEG
jgi:PAS domain S-box-containing protein